MAWPTIIIIIIIIEFGEGNNIICEGMRKMPVQLQYTGGTALQNLSKVRNATNKSTATCLFS